jgi:GNAT superfamily N-acetyltransferase
MNTVAAPPVIREISAEETITIRLPVLRAGMSRESAVFPGDTDATTRHFGAFTAGRLVGVASIYIARLPEQPQVSDAWQLRGMATLPEAQRHGFGSALIRACLGAAYERGGEILWCNARTPARGFYLMHGFVVIGTEFEIPTAGPHVRMCRSLRG